MHKYVIERCGLMAAGKLDTRLLPENGAMHEIAHAMALAHSEYGVADALVAVVVQPGERNAYDQQWLQTKLWDAHKVRTVRLSLGDIEEKCTRGGDGHLRLGQKVRASEGAHALV